MIRHCKDTKVLILLSDNDWYEQFAIVFHNLDYIHENMGASSAMDSDDIRQFIESIFVAACRIRDGVFDNSDDYKKTLAYIMANMSIVSGDSYDSAIAGADSHDKTYYAYDSRLPNDDRYFTRN